ncbi:uncharacterized protein ASPGLDRAFT_49797 [Aspergillus glaucus CBS 516.65]|uniref:Cystathionine gamma-synthase n=1 Tax=Aspergillus glaucus CBS 516.65 TaxID=1160497 RepID=A0A1L9VD54_ASPGL|nr:hypothetical protein ASPGLDRAFT_49797 [Aspergillus glaucus CBS 516.65]OJJ81830.1 hypothetical protein ASPGLDRAFT_49797 [Aspergillus glaucus CBS 516.65]
MDSQWMPPEVPSALPLGKANIYPLDEPHAISCSLPTWDSVFGVCRQEEWVMKHVEWNYPRFYINKPLRELSTAVLHRLKITDENITCLLFASRPDAQQCITSFDSSSPNETCHFFIPESSHWASFSAAIFSTDLIEEAMTFWRNTGSGLSMRHATYCLQEFGYMESDSSNSEFQTSAPQKRAPDRTPDTTWIHSATTTMLNLKSFITQLATSNKSGQLPVPPSDVFLFPTGMNAIHTLSQTLSSLNPTPTAIAYGWLYPETVDVLRSTWKTISYKAGNSSDLDALESLLESGHQVHVLFCELPSNVTLSCPDIHRIRELADRYGFIVVCDDTVAGFVNIDVLPYADVVVTSLTKGFSGSSNVTGGSIVINPNSTHHDSIHNALSKTNTTCFPGDIQTLLTNSATLYQRTETANENTLALLPLLTTHPSIKTVNHPSIHPTAGIYNSLRKPTGGYTNTLSIIFHNPLSAELFYNALNVCKGTSFGTNFTIAVPYIVLANFYTREKVAGYVPDHVIRVSVGVEDVKGIMGRVREALGVVEGVELGMGMGGD